MIYMSSDFHFQHHRDFIYGPRGFESAEEMNETILKNFNEILRPDDTLYVLGDICLGGGSYENAAKNKNLIESLNGNLKIILGNHDTLKRIELYESCRNVEVLGYADMLKYGKYHFYLSHFPTLTSNWDTDKPLKQRTINLCGHSHTKNRWQDWDKGPIYHVELDAHANFPVSIEQIIKELKEKGVEK